MVIFAPNCSQFGHCCLKTLNTTGPCSLVVVNEALHCAQILALQFLRPPHVQTKQQFITLYLGRLHYAPSLTQAPLQSFEHGEEVCFEIIRGDLLFGDFNQNYIEKFDNFNRQDLDYFGNIVAGC